jgi:hypothetical protein
LSDIPLKRGLRVNLRRLAADDDRAMLKLVGWMVTISILAFLLWQISATEPLWPRAASGILLAVISVLAGLRIGADSAGAYIKDVHRRNKVLAEQNFQLQDANLMLLRQLPSEKSASSKIW